MLMGGQGVKDQGLRLRVECLEGVTRAYNPQQLHLSCSDVLRSAL